MVGCSLSASGDGRRRPGERSPTHACKRHLCPWLLEPHATVSSESQLPRVSAHLEALGADFLAFLHPGDSGFWLPGGLAHK